ncbi:hypothetical protein ACP4OV_008639 [Aristida adscensionis]
MQAAAAPAGVPPPRRRVYAAVDPRCEWSRTERADTLTVDVSGFRKEELKVLYSTNRKLTVTGERQVDGTQWARFLKVFPVPRSCDTGAIKAKMIIEDARLLVLLPKRSSSSLSSSSKDKQEEQQSMGEPKGHGSAGGSSSSSSDSLWSAQENPEKEEKDQGTDDQRQEGMAVQDSPRNEGEANAVKGDDGDDDKGESERWWKKIKVLHVLGCVLILALVGVGATVLYVMLL